MSDPAHNEFLGMRSTVGGIQNRSNFLPHHGGLPGGVPKGVSGFPSGEKNLRIRPRGYFFMLRSILILLDLEIPLKSQKIWKNEFIFFFFEFWPNHDLRLRICMIFHADSESDLKTSPNQVKNLILLKSDFYKNWAAASAEGLLNNSAQLPKRPNCPSGETTWTPFELPMSQAQFAICNLKNHILIR